MKSLVDRMKYPWPVSPVSTHHLGEGYGRRQVIKNGKLWDEISQAYCATDFSLARFYVPLVGGGDWAVFCDGDFLWRTDPNELLALLDDRYAVMCVKHDVRHRAGRKMDGQEQTDYPRKNWSSLVAFNRTHAANHSRLAHAVNTMRGLQLHGFEWVEDELIGELPKEWNHLVGVEAHNPEAKAVHFTMGTPDMPGYENQPFADEWRKYL